MAVGRVVANRYRILRALGAGGAGTVYEAETREGGRVALKLLKASDRPHVVKRFEREARALIALEHPGIVRLLDVGQEGPMHFIALELVSGGSLQDRLDREGPLPVQEALSIATKLAGALASAHAAGVLHRDLKPDNVLLAEDGDPRLTDFGLTRDLDPSMSQTRLSKSGVCMGTPGYWPPELAHGLREQVCPATDVYGLAAILYAMLSGQPPQGVPGNLMEAFANLEQPVPPISSRRQDVPAWLDDLLQRALSAAPAQRPSSVLELIDALRAGNLEGDALARQVARSSPLGVRGRHRRQVYADTLRRAWEPWLRRLTGIALVPIGVQVATRGVKTVINARHGNEIMEGIGAATVGVVLGVVYGLSLALRRPGAQEDSAESPAVDP